MPLTTWSLVIPKNTVTLGRTVSQPEAGGPVRKPTLRLPVRCIVFFLPVEATAAPYTGSFCADPRVEFSDPSSLVLELSWLVTDQTLSPCLLLGKV